MKHLKVGDKVMWRGAWGSEQPKEVMVIGIEHTQNGGKNGQPINSINWQIVTNGRHNGREVIVDLDNNHWAYGFQLKPI